MADFWASDPVVGAASAAGAPFYANDPVVGGDSAVSAMTPSDTWSGIGKQIPAGLNQFAYDVMGAPVDLARGLINGVTAPTREAQAAAVAAGHPDGTGFAIPEIPSGTLGSSDWFAQQFHNSVGTPIPSQTPVNGPWEAATRAGANMAGYALAPEAAFGKAGELLGAGEKAGSAAGEMFGAAKTPAAAARNAVTGFAAGAAGQAATNLPVPDWAKPYVAMGAAMAGGLGVEGAANAVRGAGQRAAATVAPFTGAGQEGIAADTLASKVSDMPATMAALSEPSEIVPGSMPTTFQQTGDMGLGSFERTVANQNPDLFMQRRADQNAARLDALNNPQSEGHPEAVADAVRAQLADIDAQTQNAYDAAQGGLQQQDAALGGGRMPEAYGADIENAVTPQIAQAQDASQQALEGLGGTQGPAAIGEQARTALQSSLDAGKTALQSIWKAVNADGTLQVVTSPLKRAAQSVYGDMGPAARVGLTGPENELASVINGYGSVIPFNELTDLRSQISQAMRNAKSPLQPNDVAYGRLSQLRSAVEDAISDSIQGKVAQEQQAVAAGALAPENTIGGRLAAESREFVARKQSAAGSLSATGSAGDGSGGPLAVSRPYGAEVQGNGGPRNASGIEGVPPNAGSGPLIDQETADRLKAATAATKEHKETFGAKPVANILQRPGASYDYKMPAADVAGQLWRQGPQGATSVRAILKAAKNAPEAISAIRDAAVADLRTRAPNGVLTRDTFNRWRASHQGALSALEQAAPGTIKQLETAAEASQPLEKFKGYGGSPSTLPDKYFAKGDAGFQSVNDLRDLIGKDRADTILSGYAAGSMRKAALDDKGNIDPKKLAIWRKQHAGALRAMPGLSASLDDAGAASTHLENVARIRKEELDSYQKSTAGKLLGLTDPGDITKTIGGMFGRRDSVRLMRDMAAQVRGDPDATAGLRKAIVDFMSQKLISNTEAATSGKNLIKSDIFQRFLGDNAPALRQVFSPEELDSWRAIAQDLKRANRSVTAVKLPGQSNTPQDLAAAAKHGNSPTLLHLLLAAGGKLAGKLAAPVAGYMLEGSMTGAAAGIAFNYGASLLARARAAGIANANDLVVQAMLNPPLARTLLMKASKSADTGSARTLAQQLRTLPVVASTISAGQQ